MPLLGLGDAAIHYEVFGDSGPWLVLVSGLGGHGAFWSAQVTEFSRDHRVLIHDHRGHGASRCDQPQGSMARHAADLAMLIAAVGADDIHLVGQSMGGMIAQTLALDHPVRLRSLTIGASVARLDTQGALMLGFRLRVLETLGLDDFCRLQTILSAGDIGDTPMEEVLAVEARSRAAMPDPRLLASRLRSILQFDRSAELGALTVPTLILGAHDDGQSRPRATAELARLIPNAEAVMFDDGGHFFARTRPGPFNAALRAFLHRHPAC